LTEKNQLIIIINIIFKIIIIKEQSFLFLEEEIKIANCLAKASSSTTQQPFCLWENYHQQL